MEGIVDGRAVDDCFFCTLVHPQLVDCPKCHGRMHFQSAHILSDEEFAQELHLLWSQYQSHPNLENAQGILVFAHRHPVQREQSLQWEQLDLGRLVAHFIDLV